MTEIKAAWMEGYEAGYAAAQEEIDKLTAERDAAVADIERRCYTCRHWNEKLNNCPCSECYLEASAYYSHAKWEWRGLSLAAETSDKEVE